MGYDPIHDFLDMSLKVAGGGGKKAINDWKRTRDRENQAIRDRKDRGRDGYHGDYDSDSSDGDVMGDHPKSRTRPLRQPMRGYTTPAGSMGVPGPQQQVYNQSGLPSLGGPLIVGSHSAGYLPPRSVSGPITGSSQLISPFDNGSSSPHGMSRALQGPTQPPSRYQSAMHASQLQGMASLGGDGPTPDPIYGYGPKSKGTGFGKSKGTGGFKQPSVQRGIPSGGLQPPQGNHLDPIIGNSAQEKHSQHQGGTLIGSGRGSNQQTSQAQAGDFNWAQFAPKQITELKQRGKSASGEGSNQPISNIPLGSPLGSDRPQLGTRRATIPQQHFGAPNPPSQHDSQQR